MPSNDGPSSAPNLLKFHKPRLVPSKAARSLHLTQESRQCLRKLASYRPPKQRTRIPRSRCAAVLVALFVGRMGDLYVLLSRRSATLRTYAGDTSLPGGKVEPHDKYIEDTARREAFEEIGLPLDRRRVPLLCILEPFLAGNELVVTPVVVLILDKSLRPILNEAEVVALFSHPLRSFLSSDPPFPAETESLELPYHTFTDFDWKGLGTVRMHRFLTGREAGGVKPVFGLTASIMIRVASIGYALAPEFDEQAPGAPSTELRIAHMLLTGPRFRAALAQEGIRDPVDRTLAEAVRARLARKPDAKVEENENESAELVEYKKGESRRRRRWVRSRL